MSPSHTSRDLAPVDDSQVARAAREAHDCHRSVTISSGSDGTPLVPSFYSSAPAPAKQTYRLEAFGRTDVGQVRTLNEDYFALRPGIGLFTLSDGMGGHAAGEVASRMAIECVCHAIESPAEVWPPNCPPRARHPSGALLEEALQVAHRRLQLKAKEDKSCAGMGTTFVGALFTADRVAIAHVGDSRAYRLRGRRLDQLTDDHSLMNDHIRAGLFNPDSGHPFPYPSAITRAVGVDAHLEVDVRMDAPVLGDVYLLCSDGLTGLVPTSEIAGILLQDRDLGRAARSLIQRANELGGHDNITVVLVRVAEARMGTTSTSRSN
jgi:protein phosphatase